jgi:Domain of unknown function (DUF4864)
MSRSLFCALLFFVATAAPAAEISKEDAAAIRKVISEQIDAFEHDDGPRAFSLATAGIQATFGTADAFMDMVRTQYAVVYRPKSVQFQPPQIVEGQVVQSVRMTDAEGRAWLAVYPMQREAGNWRTNGCLLHPLPGVRT